MGLIWKFIPDSGLRISPERIIHIAFDVIMTHCGEFCAIEIFAGYHRFNFLAFYWLEFLSLIGQRVNLVPGSISNLFNLKKTGNFVVNPALYASSPSWLVTRAVHLRRGSVFELSAELAANGIHFFPSR